MDFVTPQGYTVGSGSANGSGAKDVVTSASSTKVKASTYTAELWKKKKKHVLTFQRRSVGHDDTGCHANDQHPQKQLDPQIVEHQVQDQGKSSRS